MQSHPGRVVKLNLCVVYFFQFVDIVLIFRADNNCVLLSAVSFIHIGV